MKRLAWMAMMVVGCSREEPVAIRAAPERPDATPFVPPPAPPPTATAPWPDDDDGPPFDAGPPRLSGMTVEKFVTAQRPKVNAICAPNPCRAVSATLTIDVDGSGRVIAATSSGDAAVGACLVRLGKGWKLPASPGGGGTFAIPFIFTC